MYRKYRAQRYPDKKWIYGYYVHEQGNDYICYMSPDMFDEIYELIDIKTLGQDAGITDCKNIEIYEGDILDMYGCGRVVATFEDGMFGARTQGQGFGAFGKSLWGMGGEVVGNIHDNPELMEEGKANG